MSYLVASVSHSAFQLSGRHCYDLLKADASLGRNIFLTVPPDHVKSKIAPKHPWSWSPRGPRFRQQEWGPQRQAHPSQAASYVTAGLSCHLAILGLGPVLGESEMKGREGRAQGRGPKPGVWHTVSSHTTQSLPSCPLSHIKKW